MITVTTTGPEGNTKTRTFTHDINHNGCVKTPAEQANHYADLRAQAGCHVTIKEQP